MVERITHLIITGGTGYIGMRLVPIAEAEKLQIIVLGRRAPRDAPFPVLPWTLGEPLPAMAIPWSSTALVHLAHDWSDRSAEGVNYQATKLLLAAFRASGGKRFVFVSSQSARADAINAYGRIKWTIEQLMDGSDTVSARPGLVYGGPPKGLFGIMLKLVRLTPVLPMVAPGNPVQPIHVDEVCHGLLKLASNSTTQWCGLASPEPMTFREFLKTLARETSGYNLFVPTVPLAPLLLIFDVAGRLKVKLPIDKERVLGLAGTRALRCAEHIREMDLEVAPMEQGLRRENWGRRGLIREACILCTYVLGRKPPFGALRRYMRAVDVIYRDRGPIILPRFALRFPGILRFVEPVRSEGDFASRLRIAATLVENTPEGAWVFHRPKSIAQKLRLLFALVFEALLLPCRLLLGRK